MEPTTEIVTGILLAYSVFLLTILSPGPNNIAVIGTSVSAGRPAGFAVAFGIATGSFTWAMMTVLGLSALLATYATALTFIKIVGGLYLLWLAYRSFRSAASDRDIEMPADAARPRSLRGFYFRGVIIQLTNPKAAFTWIAIISLGLQADGSTGAAVALVAGTTLIAVTVHCAYAFAFSVQKVVRGYQRVRRYVQGALGVFFAFAGLRLLASR